MTLWYSSLLYGLWQEPDPQLAQLKLMYISSFLSVLFSFYFGFKNIARPQERKTERKKERKIIWIKCYLVKSSTCPCNKLLVSQNTACIKMQRSPLLCMHMHFHHLWQNNQSNNPWVINNLFHTLETWALKKQGHVTLWIKNLNRLYFTSTHSLLATISTLLSKEVYHCDGHAMLIWTLSNPVSMTTI